MSNLLIDSDNISSLLSVGRYVMKSTIDNDFKKEYTYKIIEKAISKVDNGNYCDVYNFIKDDVKDYDRANDYKDKFYDHLKAEHDEYDNCEELFGSNEDEVP